MKQAKNLYRTGPGRIRKISVILAVKNEAKNLVSVLESIHRAMESLPFEIEVVAVDDGSTDQSFEVLKELAQRFNYLKFHHHPLSKGLTQVVSSALPRTTGDVIMFFPADLESHPDEDIPKLLGPILEGYDVVAGRRTKRQDGRVFTSKLANYLILRFIGVKLHDINWVKAMTREASATLVLRFSWIRYMLLFPHFHGMKMTEAETKWYARQN